MPIVVFVLAAAVFTQGTSEFMVSGMLGHIAADNGVSLGSAGLLTSLFAIGMVVGAPMMAMLTSRLPISYSATGFLALFCVSHVLGAVTTQFSLLLTVRFLAAIANAGFLAVSLAALPTLVRPAALGKATSIIVSGITVACIAGVPAGTVLGQIWGWRLSFWVVAAISAAALLPVGILTSRHTRNSYQLDIQSSSLVAEWGVVREQPVRIVLLLGVLINAATFASFTYLGAIISDTKAGDQWVPVGLALFGVGSFIGVTMAGHYHDRYRKHIIAMGTAGLTGVWLITAFAAHTLPALLVMAVVAGVGAFGIGSTLIATIVQRAAPTAPRIAGALATTAFNIGAVLGPVIAGLAVDYNQETTASLWCSAALAAAAAVVAFASSRHQ